MTIARQDAYIEKTDVWAKLAAPVPAGAISWRQDGKVFNRDGKYFARFVAYIEANTVRERLDSVIPGEWDLTLELLPRVPEGVDESEEQPPCAFKGRLQILGVIREDIGQGRDYKQAATDAFKRAAVRFGIGNELYAYEQNWVEMDSDSKYAKPLEDPQSAYIRRHGRPGIVKTVSGAPETGVVKATIPVPEPPKQIDPLQPPQSVLTDMEIVSCPKCGGRMWDNRVTKRNPRAPDYKCQNRSCDGVIWPPKPNVSEAPGRNDRRGHERENLGAAGDPQFDDRYLIGSGDEELPF